MKRALKLNNDEKDTRKGEEGYCPAQKFDLMFKAIVRNYNVINNHASSDLAIYETIWVDGRCAPVSDSLMKRALVKPNVSKGGQIGYQVMQRV